LAQNSLYIQFSQLDTTNKTIELSSALLGPTPRQFLFPNSDGTLALTSDILNIYNSNGTLSGERTISLNGNNLIFDGGSSVARVRIDADTNIARIFSFATNNVARWALRIDGTESGTNAGSDFAIRRYDDTGSFVDAPLSINRATGQSTFAKNVVIENNAGDQQLQLVSSTAPSLRIDNIQTGATKRIGIGLATAVNNFIQGSVDRDMAIFNSSTTASPILFGIYDAGLTNTQEAARISASRNFLIGTTTDAGYKLDVNGIARFTGSVTATGLYGYILNGRASDNFGAIGFRSNDSVTQYGYIQSHSANGGQLSIASIGGGQLIMDNRGSNFFSGNVGINEPNPTFALDINKTGPFAIRLNNSVNGADAYIQYNVVGSAFSIGVNSTGWFSYTSSAKTYDWWNGNAVRMTLSPSNNLLIGTSVDSGQKLQVNGDAYVNGLGTFTGANLQSGNQYLRSANVPLPHSTTTTILRFFNNAGNLSGQNAIFGIINIFVGWNAGYDLGSNIYTYSISCSSNGVGVLSLLSSNVVGSSLVTSVTASADGTGCKIDVTTNGTSNPLNANCWVTFSGNFF
jgi:hypothetical protein